MIAWTMDGTQLFVLLLLVCCSERANAQGVRLVFQEAPVANHGFLSRGPIGTADGDTVMCVTDNTDCCSSAETGDGGVGNWFFPNGSSVQGNNAGTQFYFSRGPQVVRLRRRRAGVSGIYRCRIPDASGTNQDLYVGLYSTNSGRPDITSIQFTLTSELNAQTPTFTLTCISEGGPVERVDWLRAATGGTALPDGSIYDISGPTVVDTVSAIYHHTLTVTGRLPDTYTCRVRSTRPQSAGGIHLDTMDIDVIAADPPTIVSVEQVGNTSTVRVTWTPPTGGATVTGYRIYYTGGFRDVGNGGTTEDTFTLQYGTYTITMVALSLYIPSALSNSMTVSIVPSRVRDLRATPDHTSIAISWSEPETPNGIITAYEVYYQQQGEQERDTVTVRDTSVVLSGLRPETTYTISVAAYNVAGRGESTVIESTTPPIAPVENVVVTTLNGTAVVVSWEPLMLPGWNVTYYTLYYSGLSVQQNRILEHVSQLFPGNTTSTVLVLVDSDSERMEHQFQVSASLEIEGEVYQGARSALTEDSKFIFDKSFFQIQFGPTEHCIGWSSEQARSIEEDLQRTIVAAISRQCNCSFPAEFLRSGTFSCRSSPTEVAYRSTTVGTDNYNATQLVQFIQNWVSSRPTMKIQWFIVDVYPDCPVRISSLSSPECSASLPRDTDPTLITRDATVINCVRTCVRRLNGQRVCT